MPNAWAIVLGQVKLCMHMHTQGKGRVGNNGKVKWRESHMIDRTWVLERLSYNFKRFLSYNQ